ncbi:hypothetical protein TSTA_001280 [Talaromyces stipitatus ATCC 10500]|uniref:Uncharacterized protein n=1 Tax=Talaromyces stipitatus (strain ATCC 10500 / CBS 375.48 / QM 6759 / NRRL 1006) TaxID=441959 RepID=B8MS12_TALSN|nr:uncharacterized protein TSTA_001280 [Talaromyces stipitatus ATCC 10500]EED12057.1 hypothetical protein TSTA_001280 [Talaromyces stipitatus ATCC 10500]
MEDLVFDRNRHNNERTTTTGLLDSDYPSGPSLTLGEGLLEGINKYAYPIPPDTPLSALLTASITIVYKNDLNLRQSSKHAAGMSTGGVRPRGSLVQEATTKEGPRGALDGVDMVRSRGSRAKFGDRPRGLPNLRDSMVGLREAYGRHILEDGPRGSLEKNGVGFREAPVKTIAAALTTQ